ncbi:hypothetical protein L207DRAFT_586488 [Hyaloscypha variabilis F]|uniref:Uncharacterized protein n=1 Tax=Hyaloscypha variabilis (strain UAMH 11265 / GT02V1 / F) TaxID=1149755 RepID=A0A2J6RE55_HYAVF|nr:hypothetical protein L207DRAFT_586488 [Hyaloscypha variabilis F]
MIKAVQPTIYHVNQFLIRARTSTKVRRRDWLQIQCITSIEAILPNRLRIIIALHHTSSWARHKTAYSLSQIAISAGCNFVIDALSCAPPKVTRLIPRIEQPKFSMKVASCSRQLSKTCRFHESNNPNSQRKSSVARASFHKLVDSNESNEPNFLFLSLHGSEIRSHYIPKNEDAHEAWRTSMWSGLPLQKHGKYLTIGANSVFRFPTHPHQICSSNEPLDQRRLTSVQSDQPTTISTPSLGTD